MNATAPDHANRGTLPRELNDAVVELAVCVHKRAIYPETHPMLRDAVGALHQRLDAVLQTRATFSIGVANRRLIVESVNADDENMHLRELATHLHEHMLAAVRFHAGIERAELEEFLSAISGTTIRGATPLGQESRVTLSQWPHIGVYPIAFDRLELVDGDNDEMGEKGRSSELWMSLTRAALAGGWSEGAGADPFLVATSINAHTGDGAYDQVVVGCLGQLLDDLRNTPGEEAGRVRQDTSQLIESLGEEGLARLLATRGAGAGAEGQRRELLTGATDTLTAKAVVEIARVAGRAGSERAASASLLRLLAKLAVPQPTAAAATETDAILRLSVRQLLDGWTLENPNPEAYDLWLNAASSTSRGESQDSARDRPEPERLVDVAIESGVHTPRIEAAVGRVIHRDGMSAGIDFLSSYAPSPTRDALLNAVLNVANLREQLMQPRPDWAFMAQATRRLRAGAVGALIEALDRMGDSDAQQVIDLLFEIGWDALPEIDARFDSYSPRTIRNLIALFERLDAWPPSVDAVALARHGDPGVRREAFRILLRDDETRDAALLSAVRDPDLSVLNAALQSASRGCSVEAARALIARYGDPSLSSELRGRIVRAAGAAGSPNVFAWLVDLATSPRWFGRLRKLRKPSPETIAAVTAIATHFVRTAQGARIIALARAHRSADLRRAAAPSQRTADE